MTPLTPPADPLTPDRHGAASDPTTGKQKKCAAKGDGQPRCRLAAKNGDLCHYHAALEDRGKYVQRYTPPKRKSRRKFHV